MDDLQLLQVAYERLQAGVDVLRETVAQLSRQITYVDAETALFFTMIRNAERKRAFERYKLDYKDDKQLNDSKPFNDLGYDTVDD